MRFNYKETIEQFKTTDSGRFGKAFEINTKHYLNGNRGNSDKVSAKGKTDVTYHGFKCEIKSNCGELNAIEKNTVVIYSMDNEHDYITPERSNVIPANEFCELFEKLGLVRTKKATSGVKKTTIQSYKNSKRKTAALAAALAEYPTLAEWCEMV